MPRSTETDEQRITVPLIKVLAAFLNSNKAIPGSDVVITTRLASGTVYPLIARLRQRNWLEAQWEKLDPKKDMRKPRRLYRLTPQARKRAIDLLNQGLAPLSIRQPRSVPEPATG